VLEGHAAATAAQLITETQLERLREANTMFQRIVSDLKDGTLDNPAAARLRWNEANSRFHGVILEASGNSHLAEAVDRLHSEIPRNLTWLALGNDRRRLERNAADHSAIVAAIDAGQSEEARALLMAHAARARDLLLRTAG
jgi:DNA-binding GntR family transcriptional regulator